MRPVSSLLLRDIEALRERAAEGGGLARQGALLRHLVANALPGGADLRPFHAMLWPSASDDWPRWLRELSRIRELTDRICLTMDPWVSSSMALRLALHTAWAADAGGLSREALRMAEEVAVGVCDR